MASRRAAEGEEDDEESGIRISYEKKSSRAGAAGFIAGPARGMNERMGKLFRSAGGVNNWMGMLLAIVVIVILTATCLVLAVIMEHDRHGLRSSDAGQYTNDSFRELNIHSHCCASLEHVLWALRQVAVPAMDDTYVLIKSLQCLCPLFVGCLFHFVVQAFVVYHTTDVPEKIHLRTRIR